MASGSQTWEAKVEAAHRTLRASRDIQFDFQPVVAPKPPGWAKALVEFLQAVARALPYVFWGGVIVGALVIVWFVVQELAAVRRGPRTEVPLTDWRPEPEKARVLLEHADRLAAEGRHAEAIRLLLFRSIDDLAGRRPGLVRPALTSRDIAALDALPEAPRGAFTRLAQAVERTVFGGRPADADDFARARGDYEAFAFTEGWR
ncbi:DUF4129 domain-containing protein [Phenylobacterium sp. VNQ135]|uniref:DUF4129 domain-containing protein n=1 Tax=Phenylobacterium sp. VNQ135 TaxID=3400922 RepID=UPI003BFD672F